MKSIYKCSAAFSTILYVMVSTSANAQSEPSSKDDTASASADVISDDAFSEIIVRAQRKDERLQDTPISITAITSQSLENLNGTNLYDISRAASNIQFAGNNGGSGLGTLTIRGVGQQQAGLLSDPGAAVYVDEIYRPRLSDNTLSFTDINRVEVLRGPQGTLFGKNAIGGALSIYTALPEFDLSARVTGEYGSREHFKVSSAINVPIIDDKLAFRFSAERVRQNGYIENLATGEHLNDTDYYTLRASLRFKPSDRFELILRADTTHQDQKGAGSKVLTAPDPSLLTPGPYQSRGTAPSFNRGTDKGLSATATLGLGAGTLKSITSYRSFYNNFADDTDGTPLPLQSIETNSKEDYFSQELQYSNSLADGAVDFNIGLFYINEKINYDSFPRLAIFSLNNFADQRTNSYAAFGQATYHVSDKLDLTAGIRYSKDDKDVNFKTFIVGLPFAVLDAHIKDSWDAITPKFTVQYKFTPDIMAYATVSQGFKSGGVNGQPIQVSDFQPFGPEKVTNYEVGLKSEILDRRLRANISIFQMDYEDIQIGITAFGQNVVKNAGKARIRGFEGDVLLRPFDGLRLNGGFSYNDFAYRQLSADALASGLSYGLTLPAAPKTTINVGAEYEFSLGSDVKFIVRGDYAYRSKLYFDANNSENLAQPGYGLLSARATLDIGERWSIYAYGTNLTKKFYSVAAVTGLGATSVIPGRPRELGAGFSLSF